MWYFSAVNVHLAFKYLCTFCSFSVFNNEDYIGIHAPLKASVCLLSRWFISGSIKHRCLVALCVSVCLSQDRFNDRACLSHSESHISITWSSTWAHVCPHWYSWYLPALINIYDICLHSSIFMTSVCTSLAWWVPCSVFESDLRLYCQDSDSATGHRLSAVWLCSNSCSMLIFVL